MDDLKLLRDLGTAFEHEPPATLARQRERLLRARPRGGGVGRWVSWWTAGLVAAATAVAVVVPTVLIGDRHPAAPPAGTDSVDVSGAMNVLLIGSDTRQGAGNVEYGPRMADAGAHSDTIVILHVPADRGSAVAVSVPRDSIVRIPRCGSSPAREDMINSAYRTGGAGCLRTTLETLTGLTIRHTVEVDFAGFKKVVDALGGVQVTLPRPVDDRMAKLRLPAGRSMLDGEQALGYVRLRRYGAEGSDISRIKRQQELVLATLQRLRDALFDPGRLRAFLGVMHESVRTDLSPEAMYELAVGMSETKLTFMTVPWRPHPDDPNRLAWQQPDAAELFKSLE
ncbi:LCP family protein [Nonomuraea jiangxiensis]|uniref:Cell envelope-related function transcriptional attenuator common domain-containing protein n=1 Tax=Nonomuraea jiangxiensis TaxID=633440 RepID=A0A1G9L600_9ACTN|nr:LCP family protein [Nonomuraea jiangxiensis]SDL57381.1 cell envelope-related function transcriptional attenuator common domain-containing protein [Nonomuraea jiangxiensis]